MLRYLGQYICEDIRLTFAAWERGEAIGTLASLVISVVIGYIASAATLVKWQITGAEQLGVGIVVWFAALLIFITPCRMWIAQKRKVEEYEEKLRPKLKIDGPNVTITENEKSGNRTTKYLFDVSNNSGGGTIRNVFLTLFIQDLNGNSLLQRPVLVKALQSPSEKMNINPGLNKSFVPIVLVTGHSAPRITVNAADARYRITIPINILSEYEVILVASGDEITPLTEKFIIECSNEKGVKWRKANT